VKSNFAEHRENRIHSFRILAAKASQQSEQTFKEAKRMASAIPFGQPILIGHHSEKRDRNYREKIHRKFRRSFELADKAEYYERRAEGTANNRAIFSDDPEAIGLLKEKIASLEANHRIMKEVNRLFKKQGIAILDQFGAEIKQAVLSNLKYSAYGVPFPPYSLANNGAEIRRLKKRLAELERAANDETSETERNGIRIVDNVEDNRVQIFFPDKPTEEVRKYLKSYGFHWSSYIGCWQRHRSHSARYYAEKAVEMACITQNVNE
jgi:hypothetical protein